MNKIVILGCGYIGTNVANYIATHYEEEIYVLGYKNEYVEYLDKKIQFREIAIQDIDMKNKDIFEDAICIDATGNINATSSSNIAGIKCLENCMQKVKLIYILYKLKIKKYIFLSSGGTIYGDSLKRHKENEKSNPLNVYALEKTILEQFLNINYIENHDFNYLILRISNPYGGIVTPNKKQGIIDVTINKAIKGEVIDFYGDMDNVRDYIYIDDLSEAIYQLLLSDKVNDIYNIGTGVGYSIREVFKQIEKTCNIKIKIKKCDAIKPINIKTNVLNIQKLKKDINFFPSISLKEGIERIKNQKIAKVE